jgi:hypothetical protein
MHFRRFAALLLGVWLGGSVFMDLVATQNFRSVDRLLAAPSPKAAEQIQELGGRDAARAFLRYHVSEQNRWYFETWERVQLGLGLALLLVLLFGTTPDKLMLVLALLMLAIIIVMHFFLTPTITALGRAIDFIPPGTPSLERSRFWTFHGAYSGSELLKLGIGIALAVRLLRRRQRSSSTLSETGKKPEPSPTHA